MSGDNLKKKAVSGALWTSIQKFTTIFIQFVSGIILARLLTPQDYGCIGMLSIFMLVAESIIDAGFGSALIQKKRPTQVDYSTIFFWNLCMACILYAILFFSAPAISRFYRMDLLCPVLRTQGIVLFVNAFRIVQVNQLKKQFRFKTISIVQLASTAVALATTIVMAYNGYGVWALVTQNILLALLPTIIYWISNRWKPILIFSVQSFKELFSFGFYMFLTTLVATIVNNVQGLLIGRIYNASTMGYYSKAQNAEKLASTSISQIIMQVSYPLYAELQDAREKLISAIKRLTQILSYVSFPMMFILILVAKPLFILLYSAKWLPSVPYFQFLCIAGLAICLQSVNSQAIAAIGKSKAMFVWSLVKQGVGLGFMLLGLYFWGIWGLLVGMVMKSYLIYFVNAALVSYYIGYKLRVQLFDVLPILILSIFSFVCAYIVTLFSGLGMYSNALVSVAIYAVIYYWGSKLFKLESFGLVLDLTKSYFRKFKK